MITIFLIMSELVFIPYCGNCFGPVRSSAGIVLSCGCFVCSRCAGAVPSMCPSCKSQSVKSVSMAHPPAEVAAVVQDAAAQLEDIYALLKFQSQHYKSMLAKATRKIQLQADEIQSLSNRISELSASPSKRALEDGVFDEASRIDAKRRPTGQPLFWKSDRTPVRPASASSALIMPPQDPEESQRLRQQHQHQQYRMNTGTPSVSQHAPIDRPLTPTNIHTSQHRDSRTPHIQTPSTRSESHASVSTSTAQQGIMTPTRIRSPYIPQIPPMPRTPAAHPGKTSLMVGQRDLQLSPSTSHQPHGTPQSAAIPQSGLHHQYNQQQRPPMDRSGAVGGGASTRPNAPTGDAPLWGVAL